MRRLTVAAIGLALVGLLPQVPSARAGAGAELTFVRDDVTVRSMDRVALAAACGVQTVEIEDPYYGRRVSYLACPLGKVLEVGFGVPVAELTGRDVVFRASDGYAKPTPGSRLAEPGGWLAFSDASLGTVASPGWNPIDRRQVDPGPFYVVWSGAVQRDTHRYPWPYELVQIEVASLAAKYPHTVPTGSATDSPARAGYEIFKSDCIACHAINGEGGKLGPDLNVPRSIVEYRPEAQIKEYVRDPASFRYGSMPAHPYLSDAQLDDLIAYFRAMSRLKHDPGRSS